MALWDTYQKALATLKTDADDTAANLQVGRYLCFVDGDWKKGLAHLAKGSDERLATRAADDVKSPKKAQEQGALAARWQEVARSAEPTDRLACQAAAHYWYTKAASSATGLAKLKYKNELKKIGGIPKAQQRQ